MKSIIYWYFIHLNLSGFGKQNLIEVVTNFIYPILVNRFIIVVLTNLVRLVLLKRILKIPLVLDHIKC